MEAAVAAILVAVFLITVAGYLVVRARQPAPPPNENESAPGTMWDSDGAVLRDPGGVPLDHPADPPHEERL